MLNATFSRPDLDTFCRFPGLGLAVTGQLVDDERAVLACRVLEADDWCRRCGCQGWPRDTVARRLAHLPLGGIYQRIVAAYRNPDRRTHKPS